MVITHRIARTLAALACLALFAPILLQGEVIYPHDNSLEVWLPSTYDAASADADDPIENRRFSDQSSVFVPALSHQLRSNSAGWIATWNPANQMGRPAMHVSGLSKAYPPTLVLSWFQQDPYQLYSWLAVLAACLCVGFGYCLLESHDLDPAACLMGALFFGLGSFPMYWLSFVMFLWSIAWTLALLYFVRRACTNPEGSSRLNQILCIAFASYALLLSGYPQQTVWNGIFVVGYTISQLASAVDLHTEGRSAVRLKAVGRVASSIATGVALGALAASPVLIDLFEIASASARSTADLSFFQAALGPGLEPRAASLYLAQIFDAWLWGNPIRPDYPYSFNGLSWSPAIAALIAASLAWSRRLWPLQLFLFLALVVSNSEAAFGLLWKTGLFSFSRFNPMAGAFVPAILLAAFAADAALRSERPHRVLAIGMTLPLAGIIIFGAVVAELPVETRFAVQSLGVFLGVLGFIWFGQGPLLVALAMATVFVYSAPLSLARPPQGIRTTSPFVKVLKRNLPDRTRMAWVAKPPSSVLPPNQESLFGLRSIHTYNSLSSQKYQEWVLRLSEQGTLVLGRLFNTISSPSSLVKNSELEFAGIGLFVSMQPLNPSVGSPIRPNSPFYRPPRVPSLEAQVSDFQLGSEGFVTIPAPLAKAGRLVTRRRENQDDRLLFETSPVPRETILFVSQEHHENWAATSGDEQLETVLVNGFYQGVVVPPGTRLVELRYLAAVRFSWIPQAGFALAAGFTLVRRSTRWSGKRA